MERTIFFKGDVTAQKLHEFVRTISKDSYVTDIVIGGNLTDWDQCGTIMPMQALEIPVSLWVLGEISVKYYNEIKVDGELYCTRDIDIYALTVKDDFTCEGDVDTTNSEIGGDTVCLGNIYASGCTFKSIGNFTCYGDCDTDVIVGGLFFCEGKCMGDVKKI